MAKTDEMTWMHVVVRVGLNACTHPIDYAKILIQIGHEPLPPYESRTVFGREKMFYPSIFQYIRHIKKVDGLRGCYSGLAPKLAGNIVSGLTFQRVTEAIEIKNDNKEPEDLTMEERTIRFFKRTGRETAGRVAAILASQPLQVIAVRTMAEFVGRDGRYTGVLASVAVIYKEEGIVGFFAGVAPRLLCDLGALWLSNALVHILNNYVIEDKDIKTYVSASIKFLASALWYPLQVVSNCTVVSGSGLVAGAPPLMPEYTSWIDCYQHLASVGGLKRGSTLLWRTYTGPAILTLAGGSAIPRYDMFAPPPLTKTE